MHTIRSKTVRGSLFAMLVTIVIISLAVVTSTYPYNQTAQAFPCGGSKDYCIGYRAGAIQAKRDYNTGNDLATDQHLCAQNSIAYCRGYNRGYSDETDFLMHTVI